MKMNLTVARTLIVVFLAVLAIRSQALAGPRVTPFTFKTLDSEIVHVDSLLQKGPVIITFWAMWCKPCKEEQHALAEVYAEHPFDKVSIISVNIDTPRSLTRVKTYVDTHKFPFLCCTDPGREILRIFNASGIPFTVVLNENREMEMRHSGYVPGDVDVLRKKIEEQLSGQ